MTTNGLDIALQEKIKERSVKGVAEAIRRGVLSKLVVIVGAGISVASGMPDYRSEDGLYNRLLKKGIRTPETFFSLTQFYEDPVAFYALRDEVMPSVVEPTSAHRFLKWLDDTGHLLRIYTQNVDCLEYKAGVNPEKVVQVHGNAERFRCSTCTFVFTEGESTQQKEKGTVPTCDACKTALRPDVVFWGEPIRTGSNFGKDFKECDCLLVMGTSLNVYPVANFVNKVSLSKPRIVLNNQVPEGLDQHKNGWNRFQWSTRPIRDVLLKGDVQDTCAQIQKHCEDTAV